MVGRALLLLLWLKKIQNEKRDSEVGFHYFLFYEKNFELVADHSRSKHYVYKSEIKVEYDEFLTKRSLCVFF